MTGIIFCIELHQSAFCAQFLNCLSFNKIFMGILFYCPKNYYYVCN